jgi:F0F1-type ATP synthase membrane subunit b/b'
MRKLLKRLSAKFLLLFAFFTTGCMTPAEKVQDAKENVQQANEDLKNAEAHQKEVETYTKEVEERIVSVPKIG